MASDSFQFTVRSLYAKLFQKGTGNDKCPDDRNLLDATTDSYKFIQLLLQ